MLSAAGMTVISSSELDRIRSKCLLGKGTALTRSASEARGLDLHHRSQARAKTWGNTLEGSRKKKADERRQKLDSEELDRQKIDAEEAKIQLEQRKATIDRANKLLYDESDRMKSFHSKMMLCDVLAEREAQQNLKEELVKLEHVRDDRFLEMEKQNYRKMLERELKEKESKIEMSQLAAKFQTVQLNEYKEKRYKEVEESMLEGELLRRKAIEDLETERVSDKKRRGMAVQSLVETQKANEYLKQIKSEDVLRQQRECEKIEEYAVRKQRMLDLRKKKEEEVFATKQAKRQTMIDAQSERLAAMKDDEDQRVDRQVAQKEMEKERKLNDKADKMQRWEDDIKASRIQQIDRKRSERERDKAEDNETAVFLKDWCKVLDKQEQEEYLLKADAARKLSSEHKKSVEIVRRRKEETKKQEDQVALRAKKAMEADTLEFHSYAEDCIKDFATEGKNVIPLIKELREFRKRVLE